MAVFVLSGLGRLVLVAVHGKSVGVGVEIGVSVEVGRSVSVALGSAVFVINSVVGSRVSVGANPVLQISTSAGRRISPDQGSPFAERTWTLK
jgi:hypothetical protein